MTAEQIAAMPSERLRLLHSYWSKRISYARLYANERLFADLLAYDAAVEGMNWEQVLEQLAAEMDRRRQAECQQQQRQLV